MATRARSEVVKVHTLRDEIANLREMFPHKSGLRLRAEREPVQRQTYSATLWTYVYSGESYGLHESIFAKKEKHSVQWWGKFFAAKVFKGTGKGTGSPAMRDGVLEGSIIPGINRKTGQQWDVRAVIGYNLHDFQQRVYAEVHRRRHQAESSR